MSGTIRLNPCPFCGGNLPLPQESLGDWWVGCSCGATGPTAKSEAEAEELWNRRTPGPSRLEGLEDLDHLEILDPAAAPGGEE